MARIDSNDESFWVVSDADVLHADISCPNEIRIFTAHRNESTEGVADIHINPDEARRLAAELTRLADRAEKGGGG